MSRSGGGENVEKSKDERSKIKVESDGATEILHSVQDKYRLSRNLVWISILIKNSESKYIEEWSQKAVSVSLSLTITFHGSLQP